MRKLIYFILLLGLLVTAWSASAPGQINRDYGEWTLEGSNWLDENGQAWDLTRCDLNLSYTLDMSNYYPELKKTEWSMVGIGSGAWAWMTSGAPAAAETNPDRNDIDDKLHIASIPNKLDEFSYDVLFPHRIVNSPIGNPWSNFGIWFDRDGVAKGQSELWGLESGANYNTGGIYVVELRYHAINPAQGTVFSKVNGVQSGFYDEWENAAPDYFPVGMSFSGDLSHVRIFASLWGDHVKLADIQARGCPANQ